MNYRTLGRTGLQVSEIALGCEGFNGKPDDFCGACESRCPFGVSIRKNMALAEDSFGK